VLNWIHQHLVKNPRESDIAVWYKVLSITTTAQAVQEAQEQERAAKAESEKKK
jgi:hypothetical protein